MTGARTRRGGRAPASTANEHATLRGKHAAEAAEDYCEAIADVLDERGAARVVDLTRRFGVSHVTVSRVVGRLQREGLLRTAPYQPITLTPKGRRLAEESRARHQAVLAFLIALGVPDRAARLDAEGIEHHVSAATLDAFARFVRRGLGKPG